MVRSKRLVPLNKLAKNNEKIAAIELGKKKEVQLLELQKLEQLQQYRLEYLNEMESKVKQGVTGSSLQRYHQFLAKLNLAISQQQEVYQRSSEQLNVSQGHWQSNRSKAKAIEDFTTRIEFQERKASDKRESNRADEMSTQAFLRHHSK